MIITINILDIVLNIITVMVILVMVLVLEQASLLFYCSLLNVYNSYCFVNSDYQFGGYEPPAPRGVHGNRGGKGKQSH